MTGLVSIIYTAVAFVFYREGHYLIAMIPTFFAILMFPGTIIDAALEYLRKKNPAQEQPLPLNVIPLFRKDNRASASISRRS